MRRPLFGRYGQWVVAGFCTWELVALAGPVPTISQTVKRFPPFGAVLLGALGHHWFVET